MMDFAHGGLLTVDEIKKQIDISGPGLKPNYRYYFYQQRLAFSLMGFSTLNYKASYSQAQNQKALSPMRRIGTWM